MPMAKSRLRKLWVSSQRNVQLYEYILFSIFLPHYGIFGDLQGESSRSVGKTVQVFLIRMETESFLKLKPRQVFQALVVRRVTWKMSLKNWRTMMGKFLSKVRFYKSSKMHNFTILSFFIRLDKPNQEQEVRTVTIDQGFNIPRTQPWFRLCSFLLILSLSTHWAFLLSLSQLQK